MTGYNADDPVSCDNKLAIVRALGCFDKFGLLYEKTIPSGESHSDPVKTMFDDCDQNQGWKSDLTLSIDKSDMKQGSGCLSGTGTGVGLFTRTLSVPLDTKVSHQKGGLHLWLYVSDASAIDLAKEGCIEITSSGTCDRNEYAWGIGSLDLKTGWNELKLPFSKAAVSGGRPDLEAVNYMRIYHLKVLRTLTLKLDDIYFYQD